MFIMFADIETDGDHVWVDSSTKKVALHSSDMRDYFIIKFKMKFFAKKLAKKKCITHKRISNNLKDYLIKEEKCKLVKCYKKVFKKYYKYYSIYF